MLFDRCDTNKNGTIDFDEFKVFCKEAVPKMTNEEIDADYKAVDKNGDGVL